MTKVTHFALRHRFLVGVAWLCLAVVGAVTAGTTTNRLSVAFTLPGQPGDTANTQILRHYGNGGAQEPSVPIVTLPAGQTVDNPGVSSQLARAFEAARLTSAFRLVDFASTGDRGFVTADGRSTFALVFAPAATTINGPDRVGEIGPAIQKAAPAGWQVRVTGIFELATSGGGGGGDGTGLLAETLIAGIGSLVVLAVVFASFIALLPILIAAISILTTFLLILALTGVAEVSIFVQFLVALIGLGVAIDYSLLVVTRWREERANGRDNNAAIEAAMATAGRAVLFSGTTVAIGLLALMVLPVPFLRSAGYGGALIPLVSVAVTLTLLPVLLATIGPRLDWPRLRHESRASRPWSAWARLVVRRRWLAALVGVAVLGALIAPLASMQVGVPQTSALAQSGPGYEGLRTLTAGGVPSGVLTPIEVLATRADAATVAGRLRHLPGVVAAVAPATADYQHGDTSLVTVLPRAEGGSSAGGDLVRQVRAALQSDPAVIGVGGSGPFEVDFSSAVYGSFPLMLLLIAVLTFVLLARAFRSLLLPLKAVILNVASVAAAYGVLVLVWQFGYGSETLGSVPATGAIPFWIPVVVFAFLFGLSMDYEVFLLARMREEYDRSGSTRVAVVTGIGRTGRLVTSAALILFLAFLAMSTGPQTEVKIMATGLGAGILLDATIVRCLLVPALVALLDRYNWWLPTWAARLLRVPPSPLEPVRSQDRQLAA